MVGEIIQVIRKNAEKYLDFIYEMGVKKFFIYFNSKLVRKYIN